MPGVDACGPGIVSQILIRGWATAARVASVIQDRRNDGDTRPSCCGFHTVYKIPCCIDLSICNVEDFTNFGVVSIEMMRGLFMFL
jgi:hypothetical protein